MFISFSAEEFGKLGSTEFVEEFYKKLALNGVAYLNLDIAVYGNYSYQGKSSPLLFDTLYHVTKSIQYDSERSVFDRWLEHEPNDKKTLP